MKLIQLIHMQLFTLVMSIAFYFDHIRKSFIPFHFGKSFFSHSKDVWVQTAMLIFIAISQNSVMAVDGKLLIWVNCYKHNA